MRAPSQASWSVLAPLCVLLSCEATFVVASPRSWQASPGPRPSTAVDARASLQKAAALVQQGQLEDAATEAQRALDDLETRPAAYSVLGTIRFQQNRLEESAMLLQKAIALEPRLVGAHLTLAHIFVVRGTPERALPLYRHVLQLDASNVAARLALARADAEAGNYRRSMDTARPVLAAFKQSPDGLMVLATNYLKTGDRTAAAALIADWARLTDAPQEWTIKFAVMLAEGGLPAEAIQILEPLRQAGAPSFALAFNLGGAYLLNGDGARALESYDAALILDPASLPALRQAAAVSEQRGELERSLSYWMRARKLQPDDPEVLLGFGRVCLKMDLLDDAEPALERAARLKPGDVSYQYALAAAKVGKRQFEAAQALLELLVKAHPDDGRLQYALGSVLYARGLLDDAAARLRESLRLQPDQLASRYYLGLVARDQSRDAEAIEQLEALLQRYPDHAASHEVLGGLLMSAQRYDEAERHLRKAISLSPESVKSNYQLGLLLARTGRKDEADRQLDRAKSLRQQEAEESRLQLRLIDPERCRDGGCP